MPVTVKLTLTEASPTKSDVPLRPRAKINSSARPLRGRAVSPVSIGRPPSVRPTRHASPDTDGRHPPVRIKSKVTPLASTSAPNPHRYISRSPPTSSSHYQSFLARPPTHSPPTSTLSFSSRSSVSITQSSDDDQLRSTLTNLIANDLETTETDTDDDPAQNLKAEAKSNRKIADLEITNRSLLAINATLESTKHKQSKEIRDLRRKLRESRLILPPRAFRAVNDKDNDCATTEDESDEEDESTDEAYVRIKAMMENLLDTGRRALESQPRDFVEGGKKVLSADEVRSWRDEDEDPPTQGDIDSSHVVMPDSFDSEDEVERTLVDTTPSPPPIRIMETLKR